MKDSKTHCNCSNKDCILSGDKYFHFDKWNTRLAAVNELNPCLCPKNESRTVKRITSQIWKCSRCGGLGSIIEPVVRIPSEKKIRECVYEADSEWRQDYTNPNRADRIDKFYEVKRNCMSDRGVTSGISRVSPEQVWYL